jgi:hypothetical protein
MPEESLTIHNENFHQDFMQYRHRMILKFVVTHWELIIKIRYTFSWTTPEKMLHSEETWIRVSFSNTKWNSCPHRLVMCFQPKATLLLNAKYVIFYLIFPFIYKTKKNCFNGSTYHFVKRKRWRWMPRITFRNTISYTYKIGQTYDIALLIIFVNEGNKCAVQPSDVLE